MSSMGVIFQFAPAHQLKPRLRVFYLSTQLSVNTVYLERRHVSAIRAHRRRRRGSRSRARQSPITPLEQRITAQQQKIRHLGEQLNARASGEERTGEWEGAIAAVMHMHEPPRPSTDQQAFCLVAGRRH